MYIVKEHDYEINESSVYPTLFKTIADAQIAINATHIDGWDIEFHDNAYRDVNDHTPVDFTPMSGDALELNHDDVLIYEIVEVS